MKNVFFITYPLWGEIHIPHIKGQWWEAFLFSLLLDCTSCWKKQSSCQWLDISWHSSDVTVMSYQRSLEIHSWCRADSRLAPSQWETSLQSNAISHWLGANLESAMPFSLLFLVFRGLPWGSLVYQPNHAGQPSTHPSQWSETALDRRINIVFVKWSLAIRHPCQTMTSWIPGFI